MAEMKRQQGVFMTIEVGDRSFVVPTLSEDTGKFEFLVHKNGRQSLEQLHIIPGPYGYLDQVRYGLFGGGIEPNQEAQEAMIAEFDQEYTELCARCIPHAPEVVIRFRQLVMEHLEHLGEVKNFRVAQARRDEGGHNTPRALFDLEQFVARLPATPEVLADIAVLEQAGVLFEVNQLLAAGQADLIRPFARHLITQLAMPAQETV